MATTSPESATQNTQDRSTSILVRFTAAPNMTTEKYDETMRRLEKSDNWLPDGLAFHVAFESDGKFRVSEIWDSKEQFDAFGEHLMPVLKDVGIELAGKPEVLEIHNMLTR
jgi:hypothetical protein